MITPTAQIPGYIAGTWDLDPAHSHIGSGPGPCPLPGADAGTDPTMTYRSTGTRPSMTARQSVTISREIAGSSSSASQPRPGPVQ